MSTPDASGKISYSRTHYNKWCCLHTGYDEARQFPTLNWCLGLVMKYWHKVKMILQRSLCRVQCRAVAVRAARCASGEWSREQECICPIIFSAFSFWMNSTCLGLCDFIYGFSLPFHKPIHLPFYVTSFGCLLFYLFSFSADGPRPPCNTHAPPLAGVPHTLRTTALESAFQYMPVLCVWHSWNSSAKVMNRSVWLGHWSN